MVRSSKRKSEGYVTTSRRKKNSKQATRKSYNGPDRSGYALDGDTKDNRNLSKEHMKSPFENAKRQISQKSDNLLQLISVVEGDNKNTRSELLKHLVRPSDYTASRSSSSLRDGQELRDSMRAAIHSLKQIADNYQLVNNKTIYNKEPSWMRWEKDETELNTLNQMTRDLSLLLVDCYISPKHRNIQANAAEFGEEDDIAKLSWEIMEKAMPKKADQTWGNCAHEFFRALADILQQSSLGASGAR